MLNALLVCVRFCRNKTIFKQALRHTIFVRLALLSMKVCIYISTKYSKPYFIILGIENDLNWYLTLTTAP